MSATQSDLKDNEQANATAPVPKRLTNAQTVCNEKNEKGKLCNGHLKQLRTAGEPAEMHLRGDDVLFKCQTCGTMYMGPPLGHVRDPYKQSRFVEAELAALLQAAGGTLPVIKKDARGVFVMVESGGEHATAPAKAPVAKVAAPKPAATPQPPATPPPPSTTPRPVTPASGPTHKPGSAPNRSLFRRSTYAGVQDTGPVTGESFEQKAARLKAVAAGAKKREEEGGEVAPPVQSQVSTSPAPPPAEMVAEPVVTSAPEAPTAAAPVPAETSAAHKPTGQADRSLMRRSTYCGVVDTGPVSGETFAQKVERLTKLAAAAKQRSEETGG
ncbi:MAG TPA: hypothetical protein VJ023_17205 [Pyrinomonadaceae bacterium]|nr:hypothetical protein [Pyrinomonadaceae bacterium]